MLDDYTPDYLKAKMSLRKPQFESVQILDWLCANVKLSKDADLGSMAAAIRGQYPVFAGFTRAFPSLTFSLATGVGKTRLIGAFIAYLYAHGLSRNFFVLAPNTTVYRKLREDFTPGTGKYVFAGLNCFAGQLPKVIDGDTDLSEPFDAATRQPRVFIYNIDKFNKEQSRLNQPHEKHLESFMGELAALPDLVMLMDEAHHYHAASGMAAIDALKPMLGLELTATPYDPTRQTRRDGERAAVPNTIYEYGLPEAMADGYVRIPIVFTLEDFDAAGLTEREIDEQKIRDALRHHEDMKTLLRGYYENHKGEDGVHLVKPFALIVCKDTTHAAEVERFVTTLDGGRYSGDKTITVTSKKTGLESERNMELLLAVERADNPVEVVIHVNMLKEGWDVNNLYTIVPLRKAESLILREQTIGRGLRLPFGHRVARDDTGVAKDLDTLWIAAHENFERIVQTARNIGFLGTAVMPKGGKPLQCYKTELTELDNLVAEHEVADAEARDDNYGRPDVLTAVRREIAAGVREAVSAAYAERKQSSQVDAGQVALDAAAQIKMLNNPVDEWFHGEDADYIDFVTAMARDECNRRAGRYIKIPQVTVTDIGSRRLVYEDCDFADYAALDGYALTRGRVISVDTRTGQRWGEFQTALPGLDSPEQLLTDYVRAKSDIDYSACKAILRRLVREVCDHLKRRHGTEDAVANIVKANKAPIGDLIHTAIMANAHEEGTLPTYGVSLVSDINRAQSYEADEDHVRDIYKDNVFGIDGSDIKGYLFTGFRKSVFDRAKFDSKVGELYFALIIDRDRDVLKWLRPAPLEFKDLLQGYEPDFVVETAECCWLVEIKAGKDIGSADTLSKKERGERYCSIATQHSADLGYKPWRYALIEDKLTEKPSSTTLARVLTGRVK